jgi:type VI protein secretion system component Hcp
MAIDHFLKVPGIEGGSLDDQHLHEFVVEGYDFDVAAVMASGGRAAAPARPSTRR